MQGRTRCRRHGGKTPQGIASPHYRNGYRSCLPKPLATKFAAAENDPRLLDLGRDVALTTMWGMELMETLNQASPVDAAASLDELEEAMRLQDKGRIAKAFEEHKRVVKGNGLRFKNLQTLILEVSEQRRKLIDSINKHQVQSSQIVTMQELMALFHGMAQDVLKAFVWLMSQLTEDREKMAAKKALGDISNDFLKRTRNGQRLLPTGTAGSAS